MSIRIVGAVLLASCLLVCATAPAASADLVIGSSGSGAGQTEDPRGVAVDHSNGTVFVADRANRRVDVFGPTGNFIRAFGWGVVASGPDNNPRNEIEKVEANATGGTFALLFVQNSQKLEGNVSQETRSIAANASAAAVREALEALPAIAAGGVSVSGVGAGESGPWTIEFRGQLADTHVHQLEEGASSNLSGGLHKLTITTTQPGANYEVCKAGADVCRAGQRGTATGQLNPVAVAVDSTSHAVYVFDGLESSSTNEAADNRVQKFSPEGEFIYMLGGGVNKSNGQNLCTAISGNVCGAGTKGTGEGQFNQERSAVAIGPGNVLYVDDGDRVQRFEPSGAALAPAISLPGSDSSKLAVDSTGRIYVLVAGAVREYDPTGTVLLKEFPSSNNTAIAVDPEDDSLLVADVGSGSPGISRYDSTGALRLVFYPARAHPVLSLAPFKNGAGNVFALESGLFGGDAGLIHIPFPPAGPVVYPAVSSVFASLIGNVKATLNSQVNPEGKATTYHFQYVDQKGFEESGFTGPTTKTTTESASIGADLVLHPAQSEVTGLTPKTIYHFRVIATNADASPGGNAGPEGTFETQPPLTFGSTWSTEVGTDAATLHGEVNPLGFAATGYFQYIDDATYQVSGFAQSKQSPDVAAGASPVSFGAGSVPVSGSAQLYPLAAGTTYHYRLVASDHCKPSEPAVLCSFEGPERTFTTFSPSAASTTACPNQAFRAGPAAFLPDCRGYEMVSPVDKNGANVEVVFDIVGYFAGLDQAAEGGQKISYSAYKAFANPQSSPYTSQYIASRGSAGWQNESISPPREGPSLYASAGLEYQFKAFTADLCRGWPLQDTDLALAAEAVPGYPNLYRRENCGAGAGGYETLTTVRPPSQDPRDFKPELQGFSADGTKAFFMAQDKLTSNAKKNKLEVYEASGGQLHLVCVLPNGTASAENCSLGSPSSSGSERNSNLAHAVSDDGSRAYWSEAISGPGKLYVRIDAKETVSVSEEAAQFWAGSSDGSKALYTVDEKLYKFDLGSKTSSLVAEGVKGLAGASEDCSRIYFVSTKVLAVGATAGKPNLYLDDDGTFTLVATLADADLAGLFSPVSRVPISRSSRVTPDGGAIAFMSSGSLTGYDNTDAVSGKADLEVFRFAAGELSCVSCSPTGARPVGAKITRKEGSGLWAAATIPTWENQLYSSRVLSGDGSRVYFNSLDPLVARDNNGSYDVYEWEAPGAGDCTVASPAFQSGSGGCVSLISSGESPQDSEFVDSSASGGDVFFKTTASLASQDPGLLDIYDARQNGGFPPPPLPPGECEGEACQGPLSPPQDPTPSSATFSGAGNKKHHRKKHHKKKSHKKKHHRSKHQAGKGPAR
jgi:hypothetical protein